MREWNKRIYQHFAHNKRFAFIYFFIVALAERGVLTMWMRMRG